MVITTYHSSKGLENKIAILTDFDRLYDRKVAYVGMARLEHQNIYLYMLVIMMILTLYQR